MWASCKIHQIAVAVVYTDVSVLLLQDEQLPEAKTSFPDLLQRVLDSCTEPIQGPHPLTLLTVHTVMLETGMQLVNQVICCSICCELPLCTCMPETDLSSQG